ncbi:MAG TPA: TrpR-like protein, YerC/YecD [Clostridiales bacterium]|nr:TrpR-like protein, YerC/YecD [Clostridiales bacterium]
MNPKIQDEHTDQLMKAILTLKTAEECYNFFEDLCTVSELIGMSRRLYAARLLKNNENYTEICQKSGLSSATVSRVSRALKYGTDGYNTILERLENEKA